MLPALRFALFGVASPATFGEVVILLVPLVREVQPLRPPTPDGYCSILAHAIAARGSPTPPRAPPPLRRASTMRRMVTALRRRLPAA